MNGTPHTATIWEHYRRDWHLVDCWADAAEGEDLLEFLDGEVTDANVLHQTLHAHITMRTSALPYIPIGIFATYLKQINSFCM